jgi:hypothetical protein
MVIKATVKNTTSSKVMIQQGIAGVFVEMVVLGKDEKYQLAVDINPTYREYILLTLPNNMPLEPVLSSDDIAELREILVIQQEDSDLPQLKLIKRGDRAYHVAAPPDAAPVSAPAQAPGRIQKFKKSVGHLLGKN